VVLVRPRRTLGFSPLRYPGGKSSLTDFLAKAANQNFSDSVRYVEPYAGGAGAAIALLLQGKVGSIVINDLDPAVWSLWHSLVNDTDNFQRLLKDTPVTLEEWNRQRAVYKASDRAETTELGFAAFFLNRTNRSGVMNAGVIGGKAQSGAYKIDARFNKPSLLHMVQKIAERRTDIDVRNEDGRVIIEEFVADPTALIYADPPYFDKGSFLYMNSFAIDQHEALARTLNANSAAKWILTYDNVPFIRDLYTERRHQIFSLYYSAHTPGTMNELMVFSDGMDLTF
jgi:DNA adenine methylase